MSRRILLAIASLSIALLGCDPKEDCAACRPATPELRALEGTSWLVSRVTFGPATSATDGSRRAPGVDLDGIDSGEGSIEPDATCEEFVNDYVSDLDPGITGIDAIGESLIANGEQVVQPGRTFQGDLDDAMADGRIRWAIRVGDIDETNDRRITLELLEVTDPIAIGGDGRPLPGQTLHARTVATSTGFTFGSVAVAMLETAELDVDGDVMLLPFDDLRVGGLTIAATDGGAVAELGGSFSVDALVDVTARDAVGFGLDDTNTARAIYSAVADIDPSPSDPTTCQRLSVGFGLSIVPVELVE